MNSVEYHSSFIGRKMGYKKMQSEQDDNQNGER